MSSGIIRPGARIPSWKTKGARIQQVACWEAGKERRLQWLGAALYFRMGQGGMSVPVGRALRGIPTQRAARRSSADSGWPGAPEPRWEVT